jgi:tRNA isopentenyl-2-thiomethyl-A-37 hydroxylase MiaE
LTDHAWCEQKPPSNAIKFDYAKFRKRELVTELMVIARGIRTFKWYDLIKAKDLPWAGTERSLCE